MSDGLVVGLDCHGCEDIKIIVSDGGGPGLHYLEVQGSEDVLAEELVFDMAKETGLAAGEWGWKRKKVRLRLKVQQWLQCSNGDRKMEEKQWKQELSWFLRLFPFGQEMEGVIFAAW